MNIVHDLTAEHLAYWAGMDPQPCVFTAPDDPPNCDPAVAIVTRSEGLTVVRAAWRPNEIEIVDLARGGTIWLSTWHGLPAHMLEVQPPAGGGA